MLVAPHPGAGIAVLREAGLLELVLPELVAAIGVDQGGYHTHDVYGHTVATVDHAPPDLVTRTAALLHDIAKPPTHVVAPDGRHTFYDHPQIGAQMAASILTRWRFSNDEINDVSQLVRLHLRPIQYDRELFGDAAVRRLIRDAGPLRGRMLDLARADTRASAYPTLEEIDELEERHGPARRRRRCIRHGRPAERRGAHDHGGARPGPVGGTSEGRDPRGDDRGGDSNRRPRACTRMGRDARCDPARRMSAHPCVRVAAPALPDPVERQQSRMRGSRC